LEAQKKKAAKSQEEKGKQLGSPTMGEWKPYVVVEVEYEGEWKDDFRNGKGVYRWVSLLYRRIVPDNRRGALTHFIHLV
jgi:hypothetical protein